MRSFVRSLIAVVIATPLLLAYAAADIQVGVRVVVNARPTRKVMHINRRHHRKVIVVRKRVATPVRRRVGWSHRAYPHGVPAVVHRPLHHRARVAAAASKRMAAPVRRPVGWTRSKHQALCHAKKQSVSVNKAAMPIARPAPRAPKPANRALRGWGSDRSSASQIPPGLAPHSRDTRSGPPANSQAKGHLSERGRRRGR